MARSKSSNDWIRRHVNDEFVKRAQKDGYRSRAAYKLEELDVTVKLIRPGMVIVDVGSAPGGWAQYAVRRTGGKARVIALDMRPIEPIPGVDIIQGDFTDSAVLDLLKQRLAGAAVDLVMSDMAPNISGNRATDQPRSVALLEEAMLFATEVLKPGGDLLVKAFQGEGIDEFTRDLRRHFATVKTLKPKASRPESREIYLLARTYGM